MSPPIVSVIVPAYNAATTIRQTLESALSQTVENLEVIVVDDGSTDGTSAMVQSIEDPRLTLLEQANSGVGAARHAGAELSRGAWLAFLDADDEWSPLKLALQLETARVTRARLIHTGVRPIGECEDVGSAPVTPPEKTLEWLLLDNPITLSSVLLARDVYDSAGGFDTCRSRSGTEDWDLWLRLASNDVQFAHCPDLLTHYRWSPGNQSANSYQMHAARKKTLAEFMQTAAANTLSERIRRASWRNLYLTSSWFAARNGHKLAAMRWVLGSVRYGVDFRRIKVVIGSVLGLSH